MLDREIAISDLRDVDQQLMKSLDWMMKNPIEGALEQDFTYEYECFGQRHTINLSEAGEKLGAVNDQNKKEYVKRVIYNRLVKEIEGPVNAFREGFYRFINPDYLKYFQAAELEKLIAGELIIDFEKMKQYAKYDDYSPDSQQVVWFWEVVSTFDQESLASLWFFATGELMISHLS